MGQKIEWPCSQLDVTPTILSLIGFDVTEAGFVGVNAFVPPEISRRLYFYSWFPNSPVGFLEANKKLVYWPYLDDLFEYDLACDPHEQNPTIISGSRKELLKKDILTWQRESDIYIDPKAYTEELLFSHWQTFSSGSSAWSFYTK